MHDPSAIYSQQMAMRPTCIQNNIAMTAPPRPISLSEDRFPKTRPNVDAKSWHMPLTFWMPGGALPQPVRIWPSLGDRSSFFVRCGTSLER